MPDMRAAVLSAPRQMTIESVPLPEITARDVMLKPLMVGICGTDFHIYDGEGNYNFDAHGHPIPLQQSPQILGHEIYGEISAIGNDVTDLRVGDRVVVDQGWNCHSQNRALCEFCQTGDSHQCEYYVEQGITGLPGAMAEFLRVPAVNATAIEGDLVGEPPAMVEPLACVLHSSERVNAARTRYSFREGLPIRSVSICGAGPAGLLFIQYLRNVEQFQGKILIAEPNPRRRAMAAAFGATPLDPAAEPLVAQVLEQTGGRGVEYLIDAAGNGPLYRDIPGMIRKQATILLYAHGHRQVELGVLNPIQFKEAYLIAAVGASGGFDSLGRPVMYKRALDLLASGRVSARDIVSHQYDGLEHGLLAFTHDRFRPEYTKGVIRVA